MPKPDREAGVGPAKAGRKGDKLFIEVKGQRLELDSDDDLMYLRAALDALVAELHEEVLAERRARGQKTYVEYRGEQVVAEY